MANYISNKEFYALLVDYKSLCNEAKKAGKPVPQIPTEIARCFMMIATRLSSKANFAGYTYKDEMVGDGIENCITAVHNFNPEQSKNPFAYFTQIIWYAFLRRIHSEKKQTYVKYKSLEQAVVDSILNDEEDGQFSNFNIENEKMKPIIEKFEKKPKPAKKKGKLSKFIKDEKNENRADN